MWVAAGQARCHGEEETQSVAIPSTNAGPTTATATATQMKDLLDHP